MNINELYEKLDSAIPQREKEQLLTAYLQVQLADLPADEETRHQIAYDITGLMSTKFARSLPEESLFEEIFDLAGELEVEDEQNERRWGELQGLVNELARQKN